MSSIPSKQTRMVISIEDSMAIFREHCKQKGMSVNEILLDPTLFEYNVSMTINVVEHFLATLSQKELDDIRDDPIGPYLSYGELFDCPLEELQNNLEEELMSGILKLGWKRTKKGQSVAIGLPDKKHVLVHI